MAILLVLAGCGGGAPSSPSGQFTLNKTSLSFVSRVNQALPAGQTIVLTLATGGAGYVAAGWPSGTTAPSWASVQVVPVNSTTVDIDVNITSIPAVGNYSATLMVGTTDSNNHALNQQSVQLSYAVEQGLGISIPNDQVTAYQGSSPQNVEIDVSNPNGVPFTLSSLGQWLTLPSGTQSPTTTKIEAQVNPAGWAAATYSTLVNVTDANDPTDTASAKLTFTVNPLTVNLSTNPLTLGGSDGTGSDTASETLTVSPLSSSATWAATVSSETGGSWLSIGSGSGTLTAAQNSANFTLAADVSALQGGTYTATVDVAITIGGEVIHHALPVTLNRSAEKLLVGSYGVAFSKFPSSSLLTRTVAVYDTDGTTTVPWTATSDSSWLTVTPSGTTGANAAAASLTLTANPTGLTADQEHIAIVTVSTTDGVISNQEQIRVGLWVGSTDPVAASVTPPAPSNLQNPPAIATDPVEPYAFLSEGDTGVLVYNVYTGALVTTYTNVGQSVGAMAVSDDGATLYVEDVGAGTIVPVTVEGGAVGTPYNLHFTQLSNQETLAYGKVSDEPMLVSGAGISLDLTSGQLIPGMQAAAAWVAISPDGYDVTALDADAFPSTLYGYRASYSSLTGVITLTEANRGSGGTSSGVDVAATMDGSGNDLLLIADIAVDGIQEGSWTSSWTVLPLPSAPASVAVGWNGVIAAGNQFSSGVTTDVSVYSAGGTLLGSVEAAPSGSALTNRTVRVSGDATRMTAITYASGYQLDFISVP